MNDYQKPECVEATGNVFTEEIWQELSGGKWCFGCTNCNCN